LAFGFTGFWSAFENCARTVDVFWRARICKPLAFFEKFWNAELVEQLNGAIIKAKNEKARSDDLAFV
jgi:hypothetical protein